MTTHAALAAIRGLAVEALRGFDRDHLVAIERPAALA
jgi:hypothetical protein